MQNFQIHFKHYLFKISIIFQLEIKTKTVFVLVIPGGKEVKKLLS